MTVELIERLTSSAFSDASFSIMPVPMFSKYIPSFVSGVLGDPAKQASLSPLTAFVSI
jgi:hypothetical protein